MTQHNQEDRTMSTQAIREILERVKENPNGIGDADLGLHAIALGEVEALEKAAQVIERHFEVPPEAAARPECLEARLLMRAIAEESREELAPAPESA
jgi:hypothetical protein